MSLQFHTLEPVMGWVGAANSCNAHANLTVFLVKFFFLLSLPLELAGLELSM